MVCVGRVDDGGAGWAGAGVGGLRVRVIGEMVSGLRW